MTTQRRNALIAAGIVLLLAVVWFATRPRPDMTLIGTHVTAYRLDARGPTGPAEIVLDFTRASDAYAALNVGIDLNGDGRIVDYATVGGVVQRERIVSDAGARVIPGPHAYPFDIADADIVTRNNFKLVAVLTKRPLGAWAGQTPADSAVIRATVSAILTAKP